MKEGGLDAGSNDREGGYIEGRRRAYIDMLHAAAKGLGYDEPLAKLAALITEREEAIAKLRQVCADFGDNTWTDDLHLADIIESGLTRSLNEARVAAEEHDE